MIFVDFERPKFTWLRSGRFGVRGDLRRNPAIWPGFFVDLSKFEQIAFIFRIAPRRLHNRAMILLQ
jgi:hypothetical protein